MPEELKTEIRFPNAGSYQSALVLADIQMEGQPVGSYDNSHDRRAIIMTPTDAQKFKNTCNGAGLYYQEVQV